MTQNQVQKRRGDWLRLLCSGDEAVFGEFVREYQQMVFLCCRALGLNESEAEDVASETFLAAYQKLSGFRGQSKLSSWLWQIAYYKGVSYLRQRKCSTRLGDKFCEQLADRKVACVAAALESQELSDIVWQAVRQLPADWATATVLFYREDKSIEEISSIMKKRKNTVKTYLFRARDRLKDILGDSIGKAACESA